MSAPSGWWSDPDRRILSMLPAGVERHVVVYCGGTGPWTVPVVAWALVEELSTDLKGRQRLKQDVAPLVLHQHGGSLQFGDDESPACGHAMLGVDLDWDEAGAYGKAYWAKDLDDACDACKDDLVEENTENEEST
jgi:hypothetical protein